jgi:hypothetical protein
MNVIHKALDGLLEILNSPLTAFFMRSRGIYINYEKRPGGEIALQIWLPLKDGQGRDVQHKITIEGKAAIQKVRGLPSG